MVYPLIMGNRYAKFDLNIVHKVISTFVYCNRDIWTSKIT